MSNYNTLFVYSNTYDLSVSSKLNNSMPLYDKNILLYKGLDSKTNFKLVDDNNVPYNLSNVTVYFNITDIENSETVIAKTMTVSDALRGEAYVEITAQELYNIGEGFYNFTAYLQDSNQVQSPAYTDRAGDIQGVVEIKYAGMPKSRDTKIADTFLPDSGNTYQISNVLSGSSERNLTARNHTVAIYTTNFSGNVQLEGNLDDTPSTDDNDWFPIPIQGQGTNELVFTSETGVNPFFFVSASRWIRVKYTSSSTGTFDKMLLRN